MACLQAAEAYLDDPTPWVSLISVARLYPSGVRRQELWRWWDELHGATRTASRATSRCCTTTRRAGTARTADVRLRPGRGRAWHRPGCALPVLVQYAHVEEYRYAGDAADGRRPSVGLGQHWNHDGAVSDVRRTWQRWIVGRRRAPSPRVSCATSTTWPTRPARRGSATWRPRSWPASAAGRRAHRGPARATRPSRSSGTAGITECATEGGARSAESWGPVRRLAGRRTIRGPAARGVRQGPSPFTWDGPPRGGGSSSGAPGQQGVRRSSPGRSPPAGSGRAPAR